MGFLFGRSRQSPPSRLQTSRGDAFLFIEQNSERIFTKLAGRPDQNVSHPARAAFSKRTCRSFPQRKLFPGSRDRDFRRLLHRFRATIGAANGGRPRTAAFIAGRISAGGRSLEGNRARTTGRFSSRTLARGDDRTRVVDQESSNPHRRCDVDLAVRDDRESVMGALDELVG